MILGVNGLNSVSHLWVYVKLRVDWCEINTAQAQAQEKKPFFSPLYCCAYVLSVNKCEIHLSAKTHADCSVHDLLVVQLLIKSRGRGCYFHQGQRFFLCLMWFPISHFLTLSAKFIGSLGFVVKTEILPIIIHVGFYCSQSTKQWMRQYWSNVFLKEFKTAVRNFGESELKQVKMRSEMQNKLVMPGALEGMPGKKP